MQFTRDTAISRIREFLVAQTREGETTCQATARLGLFRRGHEDCTSAQLRELYPRLSRELPADASRTALLKAIAASDAARPVGHNVPTICDVHTIDGDACLGFDRYSNAALKRMFPQLFRAEDEIVMG